MGLLVDVSENSVFPFRKFIILWLARLPCRAAQTLASVSLPVHGPSLTFHLSSHPALLPPAAIWPQLGGVCCGELGLHPPPHLHSVSSLQLRANSSSQGFTTSLRFSSLLCSPSGRLKRLTYFSPDLHKALSHSFLELLFLLGHA